MCCSFSFAIAVFRLDFFFFKDLVVAWKLFVEIAVT